eukprot:gene12225-biopygen9006
MTSHPVRRAANPWELYNQVVEMWAGGDGAQARRLAKTFAISDAVKGGAEAEYPLPPTNPHPLQISVFAIHGIPDWRKFSQIQCPMADLQCRNDRSLFRGRKFPQNFPTLSTGQAGPNLSRSGFSAGRPLPEQVRICLAAKRRLLQASQDLPPACESVGPEARTQAPAALLRSTVLCENVPMGFSVRKVP